MWIEKAFLSTSLISAHELPAKNRGLQPPCAISTPHHGVSFSDKMVREKGERNNRSSLRALDAVASLPSLSERSRPLWLQGLAWRRLVQGLASREG